MSTGSRRKLLVKNNWKSTPLGVFLFASTLDTQTPKCNVVDRRKSAFSPLSDIKTGVGTGVGGYSQKAIQLPISLFILF
jgi:hypothetical protein